MMNKMRKMKNKKGFTLMEMLIVVAIIAILIAIAIPTFASSLNKARVATDEANIRSGYASVMVKVLDQNLMDKTTNAEDLTFTLYSDGSVVGDGDTAPTGVAVYACQGNPDDAVTVGGVNVAKWTKGANITYTYDVSEGTVSIAVSK